MRHPRCIGTILLGAVAISVALATMKPDINVKKAFGPKKCERLCNIYRASDLPCHQTPTMLRNQEQVIYPIKDEEMIPAENAVNCSEGEEVFRTRGYIIMCRSSLFERRHLTDTAKILLYDQLESKNGRLLLLKNNSLVTYPHLKGGTLSVAYSRALKKLFISQYKPTLLKAVSVNGRDEVIIKKGLHSNAIAVDDRQKKLFLNIAEDFPQIGFERGIYSMPTDGYEFKLLLKHNQLDRHYLVVDHNSLRFYVNNVRNYKRYVYTYAGAFVEDIRMHILYVDSAKGVLYHTHRHNLYKLVLSNNKKQLIIKYRQTINSITVYENNVYINYIDHNGDLEIIKRDGTVVRVNHGLGKRELLVMCLIL